jgi:dTDP-4-dehydrorhamnose 3,5-epimerase
MKFIPTPLAGAHLIELEPRADARGMFARAFCAQEFADQGLETSFVQANMSTNKLSGTVRGMHLQRAPHAEVKLVRCAKGAIYDVVVDMREDSATHLRWFGAELTEENGRMIYVPKGFAHGYQSLSDGAAVFYMVSTFYAPESEGGLRYNDPKLGIAWPRAVSDVSDKDAKWPLLSL